jgi:transposase
MFPNISALKGAKRRNRPTFNNSIVFVGIDLGDKFSYIVMLNKDGDVIEESRVPTTRNVFTRKFSSFHPSRIAMEVGPHSRRVSQTLKDLGHEVIVADARKLRLIYENPRKEDKVDAEYLARLARLDPRLLSPVFHRSQEAQAHLAVIRSRDILVRTRTLLINHVRSMVKSIGVRLPSCSTASFHKQVPEFIPQDLLPALHPILDHIAILTQQIYAYDRQIEKLCRDRYPETKSLQKVSGVGPLTALAFVLTLEDPKRFRKSREVGPCLGLVPKLDQSGEHDPQLYITKTGNSYLRRLLVQSAHYILGPFDEDSDLRRWGLKIAERGGKNAKKRAAVAVARKLAVLLHHLWVTGEVYEPLYASGMSVPVELVSS